MINKIGILKNENFLIENNKETMEFIALNCRGFKFQILKSKLKQYPPNSKLAKLLTEKDQEYFISNEYYFDQDPFVLNSILNYNKTTNKLHIQSNYCIQHLKNEFNYWLNQDHYDDMFESCCKIKFQKELDTNQNEIKFESNVLKEYHYLNRKIDCMHQL